jgi:hypothetical protein
LCVLLVASAAAEPVRNGFDLAGASVAVAEIQAGGPPRDGIPALDSPDFAPVPEVDWSPEVLVLGFAWKEEARAYPVPLLDWHELVNDRVGGRPVLVSWCPLCGTGMVFDRRVPRDGSERHFGVSGLLYRSDVLMYDRETESLWSQIRSEAVTGPSGGQRLTLLRSKMESLGAWHRRYPHTTVLTRRTGFRRDYDRSPYAGYATSRKLLFGPPADDRYHPKMPTVGLRLPGGDQRAYPASELAAVGGRVEEKLGALSVRVGYDEALQVFEVDAPPEVEVVEGYWFAWVAFHPETSIYQAPSVPESNAGGPSGSSPSED